MKKQLLLIALFNLFIHNYLLASVKGLPINDEPQNAIAIAITDNCDYLEFNNLEATLSANIPSIDSKFTPVNDVWFKITVPSGGAFRVKVQAAYNVPIGIVAYSGTPENLKFIKNDNYLARTWAVQQVAYGYLDLSNLTAGETIYIRVWQAVWARGTFQICASKTPTPTVMDCRGAIPICKATYSEPDPYPYLGEGNFTREIENSFEEGYTSCITADRDGLWYTFNVSQSGALRFTVTPNVAENDFDWSVFNLTNANCEDLFKNTAQYVVSSNISGNAGETGADSNKGETDCELAGFDSKQWNRDIQVEKGNTYVMYVMNCQWTGARFGYKIDFSNSTASIYDNVGPTLKAIMNKPVLKNEKLRVKFSERVKCNSVSIEDFALLRNGIPVQISSIESSLCSETSPFSDEFVVHLTNKLEGGNYTLSLVSQIDDACENPAVFNTLSFEVKDYSVNQFNYSTNCFGDKTTFSIEKTENIQSVVWNFGENHTSNALNVEFLFTKAGNYTVNLTVTYIDNTIFTYTKNVIIPEKLLNPSITNNLSQILTNQQNVCASSIQNYKIESPATGSKYFWSLDNADGTINPLNAADSEINIQWNASIGTTNLQVYEINSNGCKSEITKLLILRQMPNATISGTTDLCPTNQGSPVIVNISGIAPWTLVYNEDELPITITNINSSPYIIPATPIISTKIFNLVSITDNIGCSSPANGNATITISCFELLEIKELEENTDTVFYNQTCSYKVFNGKPTSSYIWTIEGGTITKPQPPTTDNISVLWGNIAGSYTISVKEKKDKCISDPAYMTIAVISDEEFIDIPNIFTPNNDNVNDYLKFTLKNLENFTFTIFSRWGQTLFSTTNLLTFWDGKYNGTLCTEGIYYWTLNYQFKGIAKSKRGFVHVYR